MRSQRVVVPGTVAPERSLSITGTTSANGQLYAHHGCGLSCSVYTRGEPTTRESHERALVDGVSSMSFCWCAFSTESMRALDGGMGARYQVSRPCIGQVFPRMQRGVCAGCIRRPRRVQAILVVAFEHCGTVAARSRRCHGCQGLGAAYAYIAGNLIEGG
jgi:hypothetical protein